MRDILFMGTVLASVTHEMQNVIAIIKESLPFLVAMFITLFLVTYVPQISMLPLMLMGRY